MAGEQDGGDYDEVNPLHLVPTLVDGDAVLHQSAAIIEYLDEIQPEPSLLPGDVATRSRIRALGLAIPADTHPLNTIRVYKYLVDSYGINDDQFTDWTAHRMSIAFGAVEKTPAGTGGDFCFGNSPTLADCCLGPQIVVAERFGIDMGAFPTITGIGERCLKMPAFENALPANQPDAP
jgi:maleylacetoacetate isomerase